MSNVIENKTVASSAANETTTTGKKNNGRRVIFASAFGNALEFFDFGVYNFFVGYISVLFFPPSEIPSINLMYAFATFGVSFFMRPLGGILIGMYADRFGRKPAMVFTIILMSLGTLMIGVAPTYLTAGYWGTLVLILARLLQGIAAGGEVGASMSMLVESAPNNQRGYYSSWSIAAQGLATTFGGLLALGFQTYLPGMTGNPNVMAEWGWRVPFLIGVALAPIGCWLRLSLETEDIPAVKPKTQTKQESTWQLLVNYKMVIFIGVMLTIGSTVSTYISLYYYSTFATEYLKMEQSYGHAGRLLAGVLTFAGALLVGLLSDRMNREKLITISRIGLILFAFPSFWLLVTHPNPAVLLGIIFVMVSLTTLGAVPVMLIISELLPKRIRALGFALVYSIGVAIFGGFAQYFATQAIVLTGSLLAPSLYLGITVLISSLVLPLLKKQRKQM